MEMVGKNTDGQDLKMGELLLCSREPLEDSLVEVRLGPEKEASLMAPGGE